jgi:hypothetical protein
MCLPLLLLMTLMLCLLGTAGSSPARAGEYDWATPSGPLPDPPAVPDPTPVDGDDSNDGVIDWGDNTAAAAPQPQPNPTPGTAVTQAPVTPVAPADPQQVFESHKEALLKDFRMPAALADDSPSGSTPPPAAVVDDSFGTGASPMGLSDSEWKEAAECQQRLDVLYTKWPLSASEIAEADKLEARRNTLWKKAISVPGLTAEERDRFRLKLHTLNAQSSVTIPTLNKDIIDKWLKPPPLPVQEQGKPAVPTMNPVASWLTGQFAMGQVQGALEFGGEVVTDEISEENSFGDFLGVGKIALAYKEGGVSSALAETGNFLVGKIGMPEASVAVEGGRQYANVVFQAQNKFMTDSMKAAGGEFDKEKFWSEFNEDLTVWQKAVKEFVGYGTE